MDTRNLLLTAQDIEAMPGERRVHFLNPNAIRLRRSLGDAVGLSRIGVHLIEVESGRDTTEYHRHYHEEECIYCLAGRGSLTIEDDTYAFGPGDFVGLPAATAAHALINDGNEPLICLVMGQRLPQDVADYPRQGKRLYRYEGAWDLVDIEAVRDPRRGLRPRPPKS